MTLLKKHKEAVQELLSKIEENKNEIETINDFYKERYDIASDKFKSMKRPSDKSEENLGESENTHFTLDKNLELLVEVIDSLKELTKKEE